MERIETEFAGRPLVIETGRLAKQAAGSVLVQFGETTVLAAVTVSPNVSTLPFFPLTVEYRDAVKGEVADIRNSTGARTGGAITAAAFLESAVEDGTEWAHLDIAGTFWSDRDRPHAPKGPQGPAVRTLIALAERLAGARQ